MRIQIITAVFLLSALPVVACEFDEGEFDEGEFAGDEEGEDFRAWVWVAGDANNNVSVANSTWYNKTFQKVAGRSYTICASPASGDPDLYGDYDGAFQGLPNVNDPGFAQYWSRNWNLASDCIWFNAAQSGTYYLGVYGFKDSQFKLWRADAPIASVPTGFSKALAWPLPNACQSLVNRFSGFGSPWGNDEDANDPFYPGMKDRLHSGVDIACTPGQVVKSACNGKVVRRGNLDPQWGQYLVVECEESQNTTLTIYYDHINYTAAVNSDVIAGVTQIGTVFDMNVLGEGDHVHLAICVGTDQQCIAAKDPKSGNLPKESFPGMMINPWKTTNGGLYK